jgi:putative mRNA 3-end processing factor
MSKPLVRLTERGIYCSEGDFFVDPWQPVERAVISHAHSDHAIAGCGRYLTSREGETVLRVRLGDDAAILGLEYGKAIDLGGARVSLHPAGHILGSSQIRLEHNGQVCVVSGDYKVEPDPTCTPFEPVRCHHFITESTFGLPIYRWPLQSTVFNEINGWWRANQEAGKASLLLGYALGKSQRLLAGVDPAIGPIYTHGAVDPLNRAYRAAGIALPETLHAGAAPKGTDFSQCLIVAPPSAQGTPWTRRFGTLSTGFASGWMRIRGARRRQALDRGFALSDHVDWPSLLSAITETGAERVWVTHGYSAIVVRWLREHGVDAEAVATRFEGERDDSPTAEPGAGPISAGEPAPAEAESTPLLPLGPEPDA